MPNIAPRLLICVTILLLYRASGEDANDIHGGVKMGTKIPDCDDGNWMTSVDWDNTTDEMYTCKEDPEMYQPTEEQNRVECLDEKDIPQPLHKCMTTNITYTDIPPRAGPHRPVWPRYGEYLYCPPQRWVHSLEHGAAVFLYHPCADPAQIQLLKSIARRCLRKHIITPYKQLSPETPFAVITYGCRLLMSVMNPQLTENFVKEHALKAPEHTPKDGGYSIGLLVPASIVWDFKDSKLCPTTMELKNLEKDLKLYKELASNDKEIDWQHVHRSRGE